MTKKVYAGRCDLGAGIFARRPLRRGEPAFFLTGRYITLREALAQDNEGANTVGIGRGAYIDPGFPAVYMNHSCDPNTGIIDDFCFIPLRDIEKDEELRFDYSTALMERHWTLECLCRAPRCRGVIRDFDLLPEDLQQRYLGLGIVQSYIVRLLNADPPDQLDAA